MKSSNLKFVVAIATLVVLAVPAELSAQERSAKHHHYKLVDLGTLGGPNSFFFGFSKPVNDHGMVSGYADTSVLDPDYPNINPYFGLSDPYIQQAYKWKNGARTELTALPGATSSGTQWINQSGDIVGASTNGLIDPLTGFQEINAVLWNRNGMIRNLGTLGGNESVAWGINDSGQVAGGALNTIADDFAGDFGLPGATQVHAVLWQKGSMQDLGTLGGADSMAFSINERGQLSGMAATNSDTVDPFLWDNGHMIDLGTLGGTFGVADDLNNRGQVVGLSDLAGDGAWHAFLWTKEKNMQDLGTLGGFASEATHVNDAGDAVGYSFLPGDERNHAVLWKNGKLIDLGVVAGDICTLAFWVNSKDQVVGFSNRDECGGEIHTHGFLWENGTMFDLNTLVSADSGVHLQLIEAVQINERGEIAGRGLTADGNNHQFVMIPCDEDHPNISSCDYSPVDESVAQQASPASHAVVGKPQPRPQWPLFRHHGMFGPDHIRQSFDRSLSME